MPSSRRTFALSIAAVLAAGASFQAHAQTFPAPGKPIRIVVPFSPGGQAEVIGRRFGMHLSESMGVPVIIDTKPGANTGIGALEVQRAAPDGHTLLLTNGLTHVTNPMMRPKLSYDASKFTPIFQIVGSSTVLIANTSRPFNNVQELVAYARANPGKLSYASIGTGSTAHLLGELFAQKTGTTMTHVPYKGSGQATQDLIGGQVDIMFDGFGTAIGSIATKHVKPIGVATRERNDAMPDVPTIAEQGVQGITSEGYIGIFGPANMPPDVVTRLNNELQKTLAMASVEKFLRGTGNTPAGGSADQFAQKIAAEVKVWGPLVKRLNIVLE
ncbi:Bug family tripartite tricarboxylate transporter substrate binding protein [Ottowia sp. VDI28]|uniref:Bug family tripartite tricarboxylate transporter substrate binding protein n=1 Tax=Ottowia sp. VDI28 TaxID=3133968 RepID=UPI003C2D4A34